MKRYTEIRGGLLWGCSIEYCAVSPLDPDPEPWRVYDDWARLIGVEKTLADAKVCVREFLKDPQRAAEKYPMPKGWRPVRQRL